MLKLLGGLLIGIFSASLAVIYQNDIAAMLGRAPITAEITAGAWYPHFQTLDEKNRFSVKDAENIERFSDSSDTHFARFVIKNNTGRKIDNAFIKIGNAEWANFDAVVLTNSGSKSERTMISNASGKIELGSVPPADNVTAYIWSNRTYGYPFGFEDVSVVTSDGLVPTSVTRFEADSGSVLYGISTETFAWAFVFILLIIAAILSFIVAHSFSFIKCLFLSEDYYLDERLRFEVDPEKYSVPDSLPKTV